MKTSRRMYYKVFSTDIIDANDKEEGAIDL